MNLKYVDFDDVRIDHPHLTISSVSTCVMDVRQSPTKYCLMTDIYAIQSNRFALSQISSVCRLCGSEAHTNQHFIIAIRSNIFEPFKLLHVALTSLNINIELLFSDHTTLLIAS